MSVKTDSETGLLVFFLLVSGYMVIESFNYGSTAGQFPRLSGGVVFVGATMLLFRDYLPGPLHSFVAEPSQLISTPEDVSQEDGDAAQQEEADLGRPLSPEVFTGVSIVAYAVTSFLVGLLWTSPLFVIVYTWWFRQPWYVSLTLALLAYGLAYGFMTVLNLSLSTGWLLAVGGW